MRRVLPRMTRATVAREKQGDTTMNAEMSVRWFEKVYYSDLSVAERVEVFAYGKPGNWTFRTQYPFEIASYPVQATPALTAKAEQLYLETTTVCELTAKSGSRSDSAHTTA